MSGDNLVLKTFLVVFPEVVDKPKVDKQFCKNQSLGNQDRGEFKSLVIQDATEVFIVVFVKGLNLVWAHVTAKLVVGGFFPSKFAVAKSFDRNH